MNQVSVFLENKYGTLTHVLECLAKEDISILAMNISDTTEYGILRMIVSDAEKAVRALNDSKFTANLSNVIAFELGKGASSLNEIIKCFANNGVSFNYVYSFGCGDKVILIVRADDSNKAYSLIAQNGFKIIGTEEIQKNICLE